MASNNTDNRVIEIQSQCDKTGVSDVNVQHWIHERTNALYPAHRAYSLSTINSTKRKPEIGAILASEYTLKTRIPVVLCATEVEDLQLVRSYFAFVCGHQKPVNSTLIILVTHQISGMLQTSTVRVDFSKSTQVNHTLFTFRITKITPNEF